MKLLYDILNIINYVCIGITSVGFIFQLIYIFFIWMKPKSFKKSTKKAKIAILICGRNEESVIGETIDQLYNQDYPKELFDIFVVAHNCSDKTFDIAKEHGAIAFRLDDSDPKHARVAYAIRNGLNKILSEYDNYDFVIRFDADNHCKNNYLSVMNDAYQSGVKIARPFEWAKNYDQNIWSKVSATYYVRDSRIPSNFRENTHMSSMLTGAGMMFDLDIIRKHGWNAMSVSEDAEFTLDCMMNKYKVHYVADAIVLEDQPSTFVDTFNRLKRMGSGLNRLFFKKGFKFFGHLFKTGDLSFVDLFMQLLFIPVAVLCIGWFPLYYIFYIVSLMVNTWGVEFMGYMTAAQSGVALQEIFIMVGIILGTYILVYTFQTWLAMLLSKKHLGLKSLKGTWGGILASSFFMMLWAIGITFGALSKPKWKQIRRNT